VGAMEALQIIEAQLVEAYEGGLKLTTLISTPF
jgi:hypothetical protein